MDSVMNDLATEPSTSEPSTISRVARIHKLTKHEDSVVFCVLNRHKRLLLTGGVDDTAYVWNMQDFQPSFECLDHKETVLAGDFSSNSTLVATGDMNGLIQVFECDTGNKVFSFDIEEVKWIKFHNKSEYVLLAGTATGDFWMWHINNPDAIKCFPSYGSATTTATLCDDGSSAIITYEDGTIRSINLKDATVLVKFDDGSRSEILSIDMTTTKGLMAVGCMDASVKILKSQNFKAYTTFFCKTPPDEMKRLAANDDPDDPERESESEAPSSSEPLDLVESVESLAFSPDDSYLAAANNLGSIYIWETNLQKERAQCHIGTGICKIDWNNNEEVVVGCSDGRIRIFDINLDLVEEIDAHDDQILDLIVSNDMIVTTSDDMTAAIILMDNKLNNSSNLEKSLDMRHLEKRHSNEQNELYPSP